VRPPWIRPWAWKQDSCRHCHYLAMI
jgi:hypothetical protein